MFIPHLSQRRIAEILDTIDETIQATERLIAKLTKAHEALRQDLLPSTPSEGAEEVPLGDLVDRERPIVYGILMPGKHVHGGVPVIKVRDIKEGAIAPKESLLHADQRIDAQFIRSRVLAGDLLFTIRGTVGRTAVVSSELSHANITQDTARIAILGADQSYVLAAMKGACFARFIEINTVGQAVKGINLRELRRAPVLMVGKEKQGRIGRMLDTSRSQLTAELNKLKKYCILRNGLASDLLSGKVRTVAE